MNENSYQQITQEAAKEMMDTQEVVILDVREQHEYNSGHIPGAILLPVGTITEDTAAAVIDELDTVVLVTAAAETAAKQLRRLWQTLAIPMFMSSAASMTGRMTWSPNPYKFLQGGTHMKKLFDSANLYLKQSDWKDLALIKFCLASIGLLAGLQIPKKHRKPAAIGALIVFLATYIPLMTDFFRILFKKEDEV